MGGCGGSILAQLERHCIVPVYALPFIQAIYILVGFSEHATLINSRTA
ncbi:hypothetical protein N8616_01930 [Verrucomicrobia bacterium]|nr:hypothetical protein [Verrucomicrobiota bacterium]